MIHLVVRDDTGSMNGRRMNDFRPTSLVERIAELHGTLRISYPDCLNTELVIQIPF